MDQGLTYEDLRARVKVLENAKSERDYFEKQRKVLLDNSPVCTKIVDLDYNLQYMSAAGINALDISDVTELYGKPFPLEFYPELSKKRMVENLDKAKKTGEVITFETDLITSDGRKIWYHSTLVPVMDQKGQLDYIMVVSADTTDRKEAEEEILRSRDALRKETEVAQAANAAKSEFLASMSHELRTPMNAVLGFAQMLQVDPKHDLSPHQNDYVDSIIQGGNHLLELINDVLDLSKIEARQLTLNIEKVIANEVVSEVVDLTAPLATKKSITVIDHFSSSQPVRLNTDKTRYKQCLFNLLSNAVKYNVDEGKITIENLVVDNETLRISIIDTGFGIAEVDFENVFKMFHTLEQDPTLAKEGTGIGLTVTKMLLEQMGGKIGFESELGIGSTFWIELPIAEAERLTT